MLVGLPIAMLLGMKREAFGATVSICREPSLGLINERYGANSPEFLGCMGTYMVGNLFGAVFLEFLHLWQLIQAFIHIRWQWPVAWGLVL